jgi:cytochrome c oxidase accessory protein FixG
LIGVFVLETVDRKVQEFDRLDVEAVNSARVRQPLYAARKKIFPKRASGTFRRFKWLVMLVTLSVYYLTPWIRWGRGPYAPDQAVLLDIANRRFYFFMIEIWPQEFYYIAGLLVMAGFGLFLVTSVVGRAWCGYTCPQTVWVDLFLVVERAIEGDRNARIKLDSAPWSFDKLSKRVSKHVIWLLIGVLTGGAWVFYFTDAPTLLDSFIHGDAPPVAYITVAVLTATTYVFGGLMREQVCTYMCPWPRIQAAMLDENSLTVTYNDWRGEPRTHGAKKAAAAGIAGGDCVDCNACVAVCPMGIDIRDGQQLECITCALCIDACDSVMDKIGKERGLISYATLADYQSNMTLATNGGTEAINPLRIHDDTGAFSAKVEHFHVRKIFRLRVLLYVAVFASVGLGLIFTLLSRHRLELNVLHDRNPQFVILSDGAVRNGYTIKILNMVPQKRNMELSLDGLPGASMAMEPGTQPEGRLFRLEIEPDQTEPLKVYVKQPKAMAQAGSAKFTFLISDKTLGESDSYKATFNAPEETQ